ncbi:hypothetical protein HHL16_14975 [Pseudoflavitalea sp. G-6-1-2]|uniref:hypothetical protein n=1 Tax=Pseudoflavitalea sp. G-6-1-2 TaxID=2728841 RepID=UPI00146D2CBA|nr:hypothetical protein [Pseudoflavitalea sp. G-6-1-2]NML22184.1 hypothetical protein [Pseudoflavitalea sp. G-6-1-2]
MNIRKRYRFLLAVFLTALYAFIATPVQLWHHHADRQLRTEKLTSPFAAISKTVVDAEGGDCSVCSHHYSVYADDASFSVVFFPQQYAVLKAFDQLTVADPLWYWLSNKGPPSVA